MKDAKCGDETNLPIIYYFLLHNNSNIRGKNPNNTEYIHIQLWSYESVYNNDSINDMYKTTMDISLEEFVTIKLTT